MTTILSIGNALPTRRNCSEFGLPDSKPLPRLPLFFNATSYGSNKFIARVFEASLLSYTFLFGVVNQMSRALPIFRVPVPLQLLNGRFRLWYLAGALNPVGSCPSFKRCSSLLPCSLRAENLHLLQLPQPQTMPTVPLLLLPILRTINSM